MPLTPNLALPYPVGSDTADVPRDIKALADKLDPLVATKADFATVGLSFIADLNLAADTANFNFTAIPQTFSHLLLTHSARSTAVADTVPLNLQCNGDTTASYYTQLLRGNNNAASVSAGLAGTGAQISGIPAANAASGVDTFGAGMLLIPNYVSSTYKLMLSLAGIVTGGAAATMWIDVTTVLYFKTAAINRLTLFPGSGAMRTRSRATLYGLK